MRPCFFSCVITQPTYKARKSNEIILHGCNCIDKVLFGLVEHSPYIFFVITFSYMWILELCNIYQIFSIARDWSKQVTWTNIPPWPNEAKNRARWEKLKDIKHNIACIWGKNIGEYLFLDIICYSKLPVFLKLRSWKTVRFSEQIMSAGK